MTLATLILLGAAAASGVQLGRRLDRRRLNEALHELRRPLQGLAIASMPDRTGSERERAVGCSLEAVAEAVDELDRVVNGSRRPNRSTRFALASLLADAERRWGFCGRVDLAPTQVGVVRGDRLRIGAALDNLIANGIEHGPGPVRVAVVPSGGRVRIQVRSQAPGDHGPINMDEGNPRRGHGLRVAGAIAAEHGGRLHAPRLEAGEVLTELDLPAPRPVA